MTVRADDSSGGSLGEGAAGGVMRALAWLPRLLVLHVLWILGTLAGGIVLGAAPATVALLHALDAREELPTGTVDRLRWVAARWREELLPAHLALGPFLLIGGAAAANLAAVAVGLAPAWFVPWGVAPSAVIGLWAVLAAQHAAALRVLRPTARTLQLWQAAAAGPVLLPLASLAWIVTIGSTLAASLVIVPLGLLLGAGIVLGATWALMVRIWRARMTMVTELGPQRTSTDR